jgi:hypothetical protein
MVVERTVVNPWTWSLNFGFNQGEIVEGGQRVLFCAGQTSVDGDGNPQFAGDMPAQIALAADNLEAVLRGAASRLPRAHRRDRGDRSRVRATRPRSHSRAGTRT